MSHHNDTLTPTSTPPPLTSTSPDTNTNTTTPNKPHRTTLAAEKKRLRDRRAQQTLRDKKLRHTRALEEQVAALQEKVAICEQYHADTDNGVGRLLQCIDNLRRRNEVLVKRQRALRGLVGEWEREDSAQLGQEGWSEDALVSGPALENAYGHGAEKVSRNGYNVNGSHEARLSSLPPPHTNSTSTTAAKFHLNPVSVPACLSTTSITSSSSPAISLGSNCSTPPISISHQDYTHHTLPPIQAPPQRQPSQPPIPPISTTTQTTPWPLPLNTPLPNPPTNFTAPWFAYPAAIASSPDTPSSPLDILYGSKTNPLAQLLHTRLRLRPLRDPEALALGWIMYHLTKWLFEPSETARAFLPAYLEPIAEQVSIAHPVGLDFLVFPVMRRNMIRHWERYQAQSDDLFGLFCCCVKVRWPWGEQILDRDERNELRIRPEFYDTFMRESGWGLTSEFIRTYPDIVEGIDVRSIIYEVA